MVKYKIEIMRPQGVVLGVVVDGVEYTISKELEDPARLDSPLNGVNTTLLDAIEMLLKVYYNGPHKPVQDSPHSAALAYNRANSNLTISPLMLSVLAGDLDAFYAGMCYRADSRLLSNVLNLIMCCLRFNGNPAIK
jgi:hypothetical protein